MIPKLWLPDDDEEWEHECLVQLNAVSRRGDTVVSGAS